MKDYQLKNIDLESLDNILTKIESSFNIEFSGKELSNISTLGELSNYVIDRISLDDSNGCTNQQAFYKLRNTISSEFQIEKKIILPQTLLANILPKDKRTSIKKIEKKLDLKLNVLRPKIWITILFITIFFVSLFAGYGNWKIGLLGIILSIGGAWLSNKTGATLEIKTVSDLTKIMVRENYLKSRRNTKTINSIEIEKILTDWFVEELDDAK